MSHSDADVSLAEINRKLDAIITHYQRVLDDHEQRLRSAERWIYAVPPTLLLSAASIIAAIVTR